MNKYFIIVTVFNLNTSWIRQLQTSWQPIFTKLANQGWTCKGNPTNGTTTVYKIWIHPITTIWKNIIPFSCFVPFRWNWVTRTLYIMLRHVDILCCTYFFVLDVIMACGVNLTIMASPSTRQSPVVNTINWESQQAQLQHSFL